MNVKIRKWMSAVISAAMVVTSISTVAFAADTTQKVIIDDNFNSVSLDGNKSGMNGAWKNVGAGGWSSMDSEKRADGDVCWKWSKGYNIQDPLGSWEQIFVDMDALKATDTLNISYDLKLGNGATTKSIVVLDSGTNNVEYIQLGETSQGGIYHVGTTQWVDNNQATAGGEDIKRDDWVKVDITVKDSKTSIKVDGTELCKDIIPPAGQTFNQAGVNKVRFTTDGIDNSKKINVRIDNVKITVDSKSGGETPETPDKPDTPSGDVLLSENFDSYTVGQTAKETIQPKGWHPWFSEDTSKIVAGETGHGNALEIINPDSSYTRFDYQNMNIEKTYGVTEMMFKSVENGNLTIYFYKTGNTDKIYEININNLNINGTKLTDSWYKLIAVVDKVNGKIDWAITDMDGTGVVLGSEATEQLKDFNEIRIANFSNAVPVYVDEISVTQTDVKPTLPKAPLKTTLFEQNFNGYTAGDLFKDVKGDNNWGMFYSDASVITTGADGYGNALKMVYVDGADNINWSYKGITPELDVVDFSIMFNTPADTNFDIKVWDGSSEANIVNIQGCKVGSDDISPNTWYKLNAEINRKTGKCNWKVMDLNNQEVSNGSITAKDFCGFILQEYKYDGKYPDILFDEIKVTQKCGTPSLTADGLAFYIGDEKQKDPNAISTATDKITLTFNTVMNLGSLKENVKIKTDNKEVSYIAGLDDNVFTIKLSEPLKPNTNYTIEIGGGVKAYTGETIEKALTEKFKTTAGEMTGKITGVKIDTTPVTQPSQLTSGAKMNITIDYRNALENTALNGYVIVAYFNGNKLIKADYGEKIERAASVNSDTISCTRTVPDFGTETPTSAKIMFWNGLDKMIPITDAYVIE
ncbi:MAG: hypothetical protein EGR16_08310 [Clostridiales bacterium]|nr:hypothetical protein [Clostridiales bacterium]